MSHTQVDSRKIVISNTTVATRAGKICLSRVFYRQNFQEKQNKVDIFT